MSAKSETRPPTRQGADTEEFEESAGILSKRTMRAAYMRADIAVQPEFGDRIITPSGQEWVITDIKTPDPDGISKIYHRLELAA